MMRFICFLLTILTAVFGALRDNSPWTIQDGVMRPDKSPWIVQTGPWQYSKEIKNILQKFRQGVPLQQINQGRKINTKPDRFKHFGKYILPPFH